MTRDQRQPPAADPSLLCGRAYIFRLARTLVGSLGADEAARCARRHDWDGLLTLVVAEAAHGGACATFG